MYHATNMRIGKKFMAQFGAAAISRAHRVHAKQQQLPPEWAKE